ncbi:MAG: hypothetical protein NTZ56_00980 [Acidobacteria bacterium]|nr:hypothetical protein [Acidobacteriota bacterium]
MRTTLELTPENHTALRELAARRGEKGYSRLVNEAIERFLNTDPIAAGQRRERAIKALEALRGTLSDEEADAMQAQVRQMRETWRSSS